MNIPLMKKDKSALDSWDGHSHGFEWEWPAVFFLIFLGIVWLWISYCRIQKEKKRGKELVRKATQDK